MNEMKTVPNDDHTEKMIEMVFFLFMAMFGTHLGMSILVSSHAESGRSAPPPVHWTECMI